MPLFVKRNSRTLLLCKFTETFFPCSSFASIFILTFLAFQHAIFFISQAKSLEQKFTWYKIAGKSLKACSVDSKSTDQDDQTTINIINFFIYLFCIVFGWKSILQV